MRAIHSRNVNEAYILGMNLLHTHGVREESRAGDVLVMPCPVTTTYTHPQERVLFNAKRNCNPFFHLMEGLWMLAGRNDVEWIGRYNTSFKKFSDDEITFHGAYGYRWRNFFKMDQIHKVIGILKENPKDRRAVIQMWDAASDLGHEGKDFPCNLSIAFRNNAGALDITVFNRSNDIIWGAYGANAVHMSMLQEYMASMLDLNIGQYHQVSNNYHAYVDIMEKTGIPSNVEISLQNPNKPDLYKDEVVKPYPMVENKETWDVDLLNFMMDPLEKQVYDNSFFYEVAQPVAMAQTLVKEKKLMNAKEHCLEIKAQDWRKACSQWISNRINK